MADAPVVFGNSVESLVRVLGPALDEKVRQKFLALGIDLFKPNPAYPYELWVEALQLAMDLLWPGVARDVATWRMGRAIFESYGQTVMGKALMALVKVLGPKRALDRMSRNLRTTNNYSETRLTEVGPNRYELWVNRVAFPHYFRGLLEAGLEFGGATEVKVEVGSVSATEGVAFNLSWK
ncbi:MAG: DUF2378 family protein [Myxococcales bacterium]|nr:DUF2378 family protein [Myxococcales bacterium]